MTYFKVKKQTEYSARNNVSAIQKQLNNILKVLLRVFEKKSRQFENIYIVANSFGVSKENVFN